MQYLQFFSKYPNLKKTNNIEFFKSGNKAAVATREERKRRGFTSVDEIFFLSPLRLRISHNEDFTVPLQRVQDLSRKGKDYGQDRWKDLPVFGLKMRAGTFDEEEPS